jgi:hypothetical protein
MTVLVPESRILPRFSLFELSQDVVTLLGVIRGCSSGLGTLRVAEGRGIAWLFAAVAIRRDDPHHRGILGGALQQSATEPSADPPEARSNALFGDY